MPTKSYVHQGLETSSPPKLIQIPTQKNVTTTQRAMMFYYTIYRSGGVGKELAWVATWTRNGHCALDDTNYTIHVVEGKAWDYGVL